MDVKIEAAPMTAHAEVITPTVTVMVVATVNKALSPVERVASSSCPSIAGHSISAVTPDAYFEMEELANAA